MKKVKYTKKDFVLMADEITLEFANFATGCSALITVLPSGEVLKDGSERWHKEGGLTHIEWDTDIDDFAREKVLSHMVSD